MRTFITVVLIAILLVLSVHVELTDCRKTISLEREDSEPMLEDRYVRRSLKSSPAPTPSPTKNPTSPAPAPAPEEEESSPAPAPAPEPEAGGNQDFPGNNNDNNDEIDTDDNIGNNGDDNEENSNGIIIIAGAGIGLTLAGMFAFFVVKRQQSKRNPLNPENAKVGFLPPDTEPLGKGKGNGRSSKSNSTEMTQPTVIMSQRSVKSKDSKSTNPSLALSNASSVSSLELNRRPPLDSVASIPLSTAGYPYHIHSIRTSQTSSLASSSLPVPEDLDGWSEFGDEFDENGVRVSERSRPPSGVGRVASGNFTTPSEDDVSSEPPEGGRVTQWFRSFQSTYKRNPDVGSVV